jgi:hypothetical protein
MMSTPGKSVAAAKKRAYRDGLRVFRLTADPLDLAELLAEVGIHVTGADPETLHQGLTKLVEDWHSGRIGLLVQDLDIEDSDAPA